MEVLSCVFYIIFLGIISYPAGRMISRGNPNPENPVFRVRSWEKDGTVYDKLNIRGWKDRIPDISKVLGGRMPVKKLKPGFTAEQIRIMIRETCTAEVIHDLLSLLGLKLTVLWKGTGGMILFLLYVFFGNVPFILVQRYNRPRLKKLLRKVEEKENSGS